jgi:hypothetical protein
MKIVPLGENTDNLNFVAIDFETGMRRLESAVSVIILSTLYLSSFLSHIRDGLDIS